MEKKEIETHEQQQEELDDLFRRAFECKLTDDERHSVNTWFRLIYYAKQPMIKWTPEQKQTICGQMPAGVFETIMSKLNSVSEDMQSYRKEAVNRANRHELAELEHFDYRLPHYSYGRIKNMEIISFEHGYEFAMKKLKELTEIISNDCPSTKDSLLWLIGEMEK